MSWLILWFGIFIVLGCQADSLTQIVNANTEFTIKLYKLLRQKENGNFLFSGLSVEIILSLLSAGAVGPTQKQLLTALNLPAAQKTRDEGFKQLISSLNINTPKLKLLSANKIYPGIDFSINKAFNITAVEDYFSDVQNVDYNDPQTAADIINNWVADRTNDKIQNLIDPSLLSPDTVLVLVNALYFKGDFVHPFEKQNSKKRIFYTSETKSIELDTMYTEANVKYFHNTCLKAKFLQLDFKCGNVSMFFILPDSISGMAAVESNLGYYLNPVELEYVRVAITLPIGSTTTTLNLVPYLEEMDVKQVFSNQADLSKISSDKTRLKVSFVQQKAFIRVSEKGVEAAAATGVGIVTTSFEEVEANFNANHPFIYTINDNNSGAILFIGRFTGI